MSIFRTALTALLACASIAAAAQPVPEAANAMVGDYTLASSLAKPDPKWAYTKGRLKVRRHDAQHLIVFFSCEWIKWPKEDCSDWWVLRQRPDGLYLQDLNTSGMTMRFDPATRTLTMTMEGAASVRTDVFSPATAVPPDAALERRMKRTESSFTATIAEPAFGKPSRWDFTRQRVFP